MTTSQRPTITQLTMFPEVGLSPAEKKIRNQLDGLFGRYNELTQRLKQVEEYVEAMKKKNPQDCS